MHASLHRSTLRQPNSNRTRRQGLQGGARTSVPAATAARSMSPVESCGMLSALTILGACVPLPGTPCVRRCCVSAPHGDLAVCAHVRPCDASLHQRRPRHRAPSLNRTLRWEQAFVSPPEGDRVTQCAAALPHALAPGWHLRQAGQRGSGYSAPCFALCCELPAVPEKLRTLECVCL